MESLHIIISAIAVVDATIKCILILILLRPSPPPDGESRCTVTPSYD